MSLPEKLSEIREQALLNIEELALFNSYKVMMRFGPLVVLGLALFSLHW